jgi:deoxyhypusine synthase
MADTGKKANRDLLSSEVRDYEIKQYDDIQSILSQMANSGGFESRNLAYGVDILRSMISEQNCTKFLSFVGSLISTGARGIIRDMLKNNMFNVIITTCGAIDHDIARTYDRYYAGDFRMDDGMLLENNIHRLGNVLVPMENYGPLIEEKVQKCLNDMYKEGRRDISTDEITSYIGSTLDESSFFIGPTKTKSQLLFLA